MESHNNNLDPEGKAGPSNNASPSLDDAVGKLLQGEFFRLINISKSDLYLRILKLI